MSLSFKQYALCLVVLMSLLVGCNQDTVITPEPIATATVPAGTPTPIVLTELGEPQRVDYNGFEFRPVIGYTLTIESGSVSMQAPDSGTNTGPGFFLTGGYIEDFVGEGVAGPTDVTMPIIESYLGNLLPVEDTTFFEPRRVTLRGTAGQDMDFCVDSLEQFCGRMTVLQEGNRIFAMVSLSPPQRWNGEIKPLYQDVLEGVELFEPIR